MITKEDFEFIVRFDGAADPKTREAIVKEAPAQMAKTFLNLMNGISSLQTLQYLLTLVDDTLQEDKGRADVFKVSFQAGNVFSCSLSNNTLQKSKQLIVLVLYRRMPRRAKRQSGCTSLDS